MESRDRQSRIERMKREKQRQARLRRRRIAIIKRCVAIAIAVGLVLLLIAGIWALAKPLFNKNQTKREQTESTEDINNEENSGAINPNDETTPEPEVSPSVAPEAVITPEATEEPIEEPIASTEIYDGPAAQKPIANAQTLTHAVPGWQVDNTGWWYANADNTYYENGWATISGNKYFFGVDGYMQTGWEAIGGKGCFFTESGVYEPDTKPKMIALTFDDGPGKYTEHLLDTLKENNAKATFFMLGQCITDEYGPLLERMKNEGHQLGNHTYDHTRLTDLSEADMREQFDSTDRRISELLPGTIASVARTPYGAQDEAVLRNINKPVIYWDIDTLDWQTKDVNKNVEAALSASEGSIILMHDIHETTVQSCDIIIPKLIEQGYELVTVEELAKAHGVDMKNSVTYYAFTEEYMAKMNATEGGETAEGSAELTE